MARSHHGKSRRIPKVDREGSARNTTRTALRNGQWDDMPSTFPSHYNRRAERGQ